MEIRFTRRFVKDLKHLNKKHPQIRGDVDELIAQFQRDETPGDRVQGMGDQIIYKVRLRISGSNKGKSSGYRVIYWLRTLSSIVLLTIY